LGSVFIDDLFLVMVSLKNAIFQLIKAKPLEFFPLFEKLAIKNRDFHELKPW